jgi:excisionase family DNA binding protein
MLRTIEEREKTDKDSRAAEEIRREIQRMLRENEGASDETSMLTDDSDSNIDLPDTIIQAITSVLLDVRKEKGISIPLDQMELTERQAADMMMVSETYFQTLLEKGKIPFHTVGDKRRIKFINLLHYKSDRFIAACRALNEMTALQEEMGLY